MLSDFPRKFGAYVLLGPLGEGGMGAVYLAMSGHQEMETLCVVKRLLPALRAQPEQVRRFRHEADLARRLVHSNLAHTHNIGEVDGEVFLVQEFVEGHDVSSLLDELRGRRQALPVAVAAHIASEIARGLVYAHGFEKLELVHRDINPPNIRLTYAGEVKLLDFGIASSNLHGDVLAEHQGAGKLWHLAPEQVRPGGQVDQRTDIYALGVVLWELLTRRPVGTVLEGGNEVRRPETEGEVLLWITRGEHQAPSTFNPEVPPELDALVVKATHVNPDYRHACAEDFRREVATFIPADSHPESALSALLGELFSPEAVREERQRQIEVARHLLAVSGVHRNGHTRATDVRKEAGEAGARPSRTWLPWLVPAGAFTLAGLVALAWPRSPVEDGRNHAPEATAPSSQTATRTSPVPPAAPRPEPAVPLPKPATLAPAPATAPATPVPAPAMVPRPVEPVRGASDTRAQVAVAPAVQPAAVAVAPKLDHLRLARDAFNARDWPRALAEGKLAVAAGGDADAHALLGNTYFKMGRFVDAEQAYDRAVALDPKNTLLEERLRIAKVRAAEGKPVEKN